MDTTSTPTMSPSAPAVSIVIPVYNLEPYLAPCLDSVRRQTFRDFEAIVVDDGSTDGSLAEIRRLTAGDDRFVVVPTKNQGVARARETALAKARGRYVCFLDGDDLFEPEMLQRLVEAIESSDCDIVCCDYKRISASYEAPVRSNRTGEISGLEFLEAMLCHAIPVTIWGKIYRRELFDADLRHYPLRLGQDVMINIQIACRQPRVRFIDYVGYGYVQRAGSSNHRGFDIDYCRTYATVLDEVLYRHKDTLGERIEFLSLLNALRWYSVYLGKSHHRWVGNTEYVRELRARIANHRSELQAYGMRDRMWMVSLDRYRLLRPIGTVWATMLRWRTSLCRRLAR